MSVEEASKIARGARFERYGLLPLQDYKNIAMFMVVWIVVMFFVNRNSFVQRWRAKCSPKYAKNWDGYMLSLVHALFASSYGWVGWFETWRADYSIRYECSDTWMLEWTFVLNDTFIAYIVIDSLRELINGTFAMDACIHHMIFICNALIWHYEAMGCGLFFYGMIGETSTVFLDLRWLFIATGATKTQPKLFGIISQLFALTFFITRNVLLGYAVVYMSIELLIPSLDSFHWFQLSCVCLILGYALNTFWLTKIVGAVLGGGKQGTATRATLNQPNKHVDGENGATSTTTTTVKSPLRRSTRGRKAD